MTLRAQRQGGSVVAVDQLPPGLHLGNAAVSYVRYLAKMVWPANLAVFYPLPLDGIVALKVAASQPALAADTILVLGMRKRSPCWRWAGAGTSWRWRRSSASCRWGCNRWPTAICTSR